MTLLIDDVKKTLQKTKMELDQSLAFCLAAAESTNILREQDETTRAETCAVKEHAEMAVMVCTSYRITSELR